MIPQGAADAAAFAISKDAVFYVIIAKRTAGYWPGFHTTHLYAQGVVPHTSRPSATRYIENRMDKDSISGVSIGVNPEDMGGIAKRGTLEFTFYDNDDWYSGLNAQGIYYENRGVTLWLAFQTTTAGSGDLKLWTGTIREVERDVKGGKIRCLCESIDVQYSKETPPNSWGATSLDPARAKGEPKALLFGAHELTPSFQLTSATDPATGDPGGTHGPAYWFADPSLSVGLHGVSGLEFGDAGLELATGGTAEILDSYVTLLGAGRVVMPYRTSNKLSIRFDIALGDFQKGGTYAPSTSNWIAAVDDDDATAFILSSYVIGAASLVYPVKVPLIGLAGDIPVISGSQPKVYLGYRISASDSYSGGSPFPLKVSLFFAKNRNAKIWTISGSFPYTETADPAFHRKDLATPASPFTETFYDAVHTAEAASFSTASASGGSAVPLTTLSDLSEGLLCVHVELQEGAGLAYQQNVRLYEIRGLRVYADVAYPSDAGIYVNARGYKDLSTSPDWITGTAGTLIENPAHIACWVARYLTNAGLTYTPRADFWAVSLKRNGWKCANLVTERMQTDDLLAEVARVGLFWVWCDYQGMYRCFTPDAVTAPTFTLRRESVVGGALTKARQTPLKDVATSFRFLYKKNPITGAFDGTLTCDASTSSTSIGAASVALCASAQDRYTAGVVVPITLECDWIRDDATAAEWAKQQIKWRTRRNWLIEMDLDVTMAVVEPGDTFNFYPTQWPDLPAAVVGAQFVNVEVRVNPEKNTVSVTAMETS